MSTFTTNAIVLGYENRGEHDRVYHLFTQKYGKMSVLAKGGQKILSKLAPHLEPPAISRLMVAKGRLIDKLAGAEIKKSFPNIRGDFHKREVLFFCFKIVNLSTRPEGADEGVYKFLEEFMGFLDTPPSPPYSDRGVGTGGVLGGLEIKENRVSIIISFLLRFFSLIGFHPTLPNPPLYKGGDGGVKEKVEKWVSGILEREIKIC